MRVSSTRIPENILQLRGLARLKLLEVLEQEGPLTIYDIYPHVERLFPENCDPLVPCPHRKSISDSDTEWHHQVRWALDDLKLNELAFNSATGRPWVRIGDDYLRLLNGSQVVIRHGTRFCLKRPCPLRNTPISGTHGRSLPRSSVVTVTDRLPVWDPNGYVRWFFVIASHAGPLSSATGWIRKADLRADRAEWLGTT